MKTRVSHLNLLAENVEQSRFLGDNCGACCMYFAVPWENASLYACLTGFLKMCPKVTVMKFP